MKRIIYGLLSLLLTTLIVVSCFGTGDLYGEAGGRIGNWINDYLLFHSLTPVEVQTMTALGSKFIGHYTLFALDGLFYWLFLSTFQELGKKKAAAFIAFGLCVSIAGEVIQMFIEGRFPAFADVVINFTGFSMIPLIAVLYRVFNPRRVWRGDISR